MQPTIYDKKPVFRVKNWFFAKPTLQRDQWSKLSALTNFHVNMGNLRNRHKTHSGWVFLSLLPCYETWVGRDSKGPNIPGVLSDFGDRWLVSKVPLRAITYQKFTEPFRGVPMVRGKTCAKNAFSIWPLHKVGFAPMAISGQRSGIFFKMPPHG